MTQLFKTAMKISEHSQRKTAVCHDDSDVKFEEVQKANLESEKKQTNLRQTNYISQLDLYCYQM